MKEYIKKFDSASAADNYPIADIPFTTSIASNPVQNLVCNQENKKISIDGQGNASIVDAGPELISFTVIKFSSDNYGQGLSYSDPRTEHCEAGMTISEFVDSDYNLPNNPIVDNGESIGCYGWGSPDYKYIHGRYEGYSNGQHGWSLVRPESGDDVGIWTLEDEQTVIQEGATYYYLETRECLLGDTEVTMVDGSTKQIKDIVVGDEVLSLDLETGKEVVRKVIYTDADENKSTTVWDEWTFSDGTILKTAHRHEFFNVEANKFKYMDEWQIGEHTLKQDGSTPALIKHTVHEEVVNHYKITLEGSNNFFANGCLTGDRYCNDVDIKILKAQ